MVAATLLIPGRYNGPDGSANGGYACGAVAQLVGGTAEVTLRRPPPLDRPLEVQREPDLVRVVDDGVVVAEGRPLAGLDVSPPLLVGAQDAAAAEQRYAGLVGHPFPRCFACGPGRPPGDGLHLRPGAVADGVVACTWRPADDGAADDGTGHVRPEFVSAALDCPSGWAGDMTPNRPVVLGRLAVAQRAPVPADAPLVVTGWVIEGGARKYIAGSAILDDEGTVYATAAATWVYVTG